MGKESSNKQYTFNEYLCYQILNNKKLKDFFELLNERAEEINKRYSKDIIDLFVKTGDEYIEAEKECEALLDKIVRSGITASRKGKKATCMIVKKTDGLGFGGNNKYEYTFRSFNDVFNGVNLTVDMLENNINPYEERYQLFEERNKDVLIIINKLEKQIAEKKKKLKRSIFRKEKDLNEISILEKEMRRFNGILEEREKIKEKRDMVSGLTFEQKEAILNYLRKVNECKELSEKLESCVDQYQDINIKFYGKRINTQKWEEALQTMLDSKELTKENLEGINKFLQPFIAERNKKIFYKGTTLYFDSHGGNNFHSLIEWYVNCMLPSKIKENNKLNDKKSR